MVQDARTILKTIRLKSFKTLWGINDTKEGNKVCESAETRACLKTQGSSTDEIIIIIFNHYISITLFKGK